jgi:hypothetical protein
MNEASLGSIAQTWSSKAIEGDFLTFWWSENTHGRSNVVRRPSRSRIWCGRQLVVLRLLWSYDQLLATISVWSAGSGVLGLSS